MIKNFTPHSVNLYMDEGVIEFPSVGSIRLTESAQQIGEADGYPIMKVTYGSTELPEQEPGVWLIVSALVKNAFPSRNDLIIPYDCVRDETGRIIGCRSFA